MSSIIKSGDSGYTAKVDSRNRLKTFAVTQIETIDRSRNGEAFLLVHETVMLTSDTESFVFYAKNNDTVQWILEKVTVTFGKSTGGDGGDFTSRVTIFPNGGTLLNGTDGVAINLNIGDPKILAVTIKSGSEGATATGGNDLFPSIIPHDQDVFDVVTGPVVFQPGTSIAYAVTPPAGNTAIDVKFNALAYRDTE